MLLFEVLCLLQLLTICISLKSFEAYRMLQYEKNQRPFGSSKSSIENLIINPIFGDHDLGRNVGVISIENLTLQLLQSLSNRRCQSLLIILPNKNDNTSTIYTDLFYLKFQEIEQYLLTNSFDFSIFFAFNDNNIIPQLIETSNDLFERYGNKEPDYWEIENRKWPANQLMSPLSMHNLYQLSGSEISEAITQIKFTNLFGRINRVNMQNTQQENEKYIVITANHDSFGIVPNIAFGVNDNGSGITSIMCLMNLFYKLYEKNKQNNVAKEKYSLLFLLTAGGYTNYKGSTKFIEDNKSFIKNIEMVLCIDSIGIGDNLYLYTAQQNQYFNNNNYKDIFTKVAKEMGINLSVNNKTIETDTRLNGWHHEEFSRNKINSITISSKSDKYLTWNGTSILDNIKRIKLKILYRNIEYLSNVLLSVIYDSDDRENTHINERYMNNYINYLNQMPRFGPYHFKSSYLKKLKNDFQLNCHESNIMQYPENELYEKYYSTNIVKINVFHVKPYIFDLLFMISTLIYLFIFYVGMYRINQS